MLKDSNRREWSGHGDDEGPNAKKARAITEAIHSDLSTEEVQIDMAKFMREDMTAKAFFSSKKRKKLSFQDIRQWIAGNEDLKMGAYLKFCLYPAFKEALLRLMSEIENVMTDVKRSEQILLVHGVPKIGKTALAHCISYMLALYAGSEESVGYLKLANSKKSDHGNDGIKSEFVDSFCQRKLVVVDQVNTNDLDLASILNIARLRFTVCGARVPIIMFTSGRYTPDEKWLEKVDLSLIAYKVISMEIDITLISKHRNSLEMENAASERVSNEELLEVTSGFWRMIKCLTNVTSHIRGTSSKSLNEKLRDIIYQPPNKNFVEKSSIKHFIWLAWFDLIAKELPPFEEFSQNYCTMVPEMAEYLGQLLSGKESNSDVGMKILLDMVDITGDVMYEANGYLEFSVESYMYKFMHREYLYRVLKRAREIHLETSIAKRRGIMTQTFSLLTDENNSLYKGVRGRLLGNIISAICEKDSLGMIIYRGAVEFFSVKRIEHGASYASLCNLPVNDSQCMLKDMSFWVVLKVPGQATFRAYDFAYMETRPGGDTPVIEKLQLIQVSGNPFGKPLRQQQNMMEVLKDVRNRLVKNNLVKKDDVERVVTPYFVHPHEGNDRVELQSTSGHTMMVEVIGFPNRFLNII